MDTTGGIPPVGPVLGVARHLHSCPLCGGPNPFLADPPPDPEAVREPSLPPRAQGPAQSAPPPELGGPPPPPPDPYAAMDHPDFGGRLTVFVLCYGPHADLARRCVGSILDSVPPARLDLRLIGNAVCPETEAYLRSVPARRLYLHAENRLKYPAMREAFRDPRCPVETPYLAWFDDDSYAVDPLWAARLAEAVALNHRHGSRLYGIRFCHDLAPHFRGGHRPDLWFKSAPWWREVPFGTRHSERPADPSGPPGTVVHFVTGGFWAAATEAVRAADVPDARLGHNGGDVCVGEQFRQAGFRLCPFNAHKALVHSSGAPRRGHSEAFPWAAPGG